MKKVLIFTALLALASFGFAGVAKADSVSASDGFGGTFNATTSCSASLVCTITLTIDTSGSSLSDINAVAIKVGTTDVGGTFSITGQSNGDLASDWTLSSGALNSSTTCSAGGNGQLCAFDPDFTGVNTGGTLVFTWTGVQVDADSIQHVGYQYNNGSATSTPNGNIVSCSFTNDVATDCGGTTKTPEPASLTLLGLGLLGVPFLRRKK
jgi:hypothetical protein